MEVLNELNAERSTMSSSGKAGNGSAGEQPPTPSPVEGAWAILRDVNQHENPQALTKLLTDLGIIDMSYLQKCTNSEMESIAVLLRPAPQRLFKELLSNVVFARDLQQAWGILNDGKKVRDMEGLRGVLDNEGISEAEDLEEVQQEKLMHIATFLKPTGETRFKRAMKLG
jgi:hypothetical protein